MTSLTDSLVYVDANAFILFGEGHTELAPRLRSLFSDMAAGALEIVTSDLTLAEVLVGPFKKARPELAFAYERLLSPRAHFARAPITTGILRRILDRGLSLASASGDHTQKD